jgi:hypothetical protein
MNIVDEYAQSVMSGVVPAGKTAVIYALCDSREADPVRRVRYIGQTVRSLARRLKIHWQTANAGAREHRATWMRSVRAGGGEVLVEALEFVSAADADAAEMRLIAEWRERGSDLTNSTAGGGGARQVSISAETRAKMSLSASRRRASPQARRAMSAAISAAFSTPEKRAQLRALQLGRTRSAETRAKMSTARRGEGNGLSKLSWDAVERIRQRYAAGGISLAALGREFGVSSPTVHRVVHHRGWVAA